MPIGRSGGQPDLAVHDHGSGPAHIRDFRFPLDVVGLAPMQRESGRFGRRRWARGIRANPRARPSFRQP
jgi:hypothetical protein